MLQIQGKIRDKSIIYKIILLTNKFSKMTFFNRISRIMILKILETLMMVIIVMLNQSYQKVHQINKFNIRPENKTKKQDSLERIRI